MVRFPFGVRLISHRVALLGMDDTNSRFVPGGCNSRLDSSISGRVPLHQFLRMQWPIPQGVLDRR